MGARGWPGAADWAQGAQGIAPTIVGGSKKHGGPDLGPTRAREAWKGLGVDGLGIGDDAPGPSFPVDQRPKLTVRMVARLQGFPDWWEFSGRKTAAYRQVGNAFPPPVARALGGAIRDALTHASPGSANAGHHASPPGLSGVRPDLPPGRTRTASTMGHIDHGRAPGAPSTYPAKRAPRWAICPVWAHRSAGNVGAGASVTRPGRVRWR